MWAKTENNFFLSSMCVEPLLWCAQEIAQKKYSFHVREKKLTSKKFDQINK